MNIYFLENLEKKQSIFLANIQAYKDRLNEAHGIEVRFTDTIHEANISESLYFRFCSDLKSEWLVYSRRIVGLFCWKKVWT